MMKTTIQKLNDFGQSVWFDNISRSLIDNGKLKEMIDMGLRGMTSNPTIFDKAISQSNSYDNKIAQLKNMGKSTFQIYDELTIQDIQDAADMLKPVYEQTNGLDGYISLEINPLLASKVKETIEEGKRLFKKVNRPNLMLKVPSTKEGFDAVEELLALGINVNVTLIFSVEQYIKTAQAFLRGVERLLNRVDDLSGIASVASIFVSRIDTAADQMIDQRLTQEAKGTVNNKLQSLKGKTAVANSQLIFQKYLEIFSQDNFKRLQAKGARRQRVLWASTSTKNPAYNDIKYVTELIGKNSVNTMPDATFDAFLDHGNIKEALPGDIPKAENIINDLKSFGIDVDNICVKLLQDGVEAFVKSFESLLHSIEEKAQVVCKK